MTQNRLANYTEYKNTEIEWIGQTPLHWKVTRNKDIFEERGSLSSTGDETLLTVSHITGVTRRADKNVNMFMAESMEGYKQAQKGDLVINTMWAWMGALGTCNEGGICSPAYGVYKPKRHIPYDHRYFDYLYRTPKFVTEMTKNSKGIVSSRLRLYPKDFFQINTALPPLSEQTAIANYINLKTSQIDRKIDLLTNKIINYNNLKQTIINDTVTQGLDKSLDFKDSGVEWIGVIPAHWTVVRLKDLGTLRSSNIDKKDEYEITALVVHYNDVIKNSIVSKITDLQYTTCTRAQFISSKLRPGDLVITKDSMDIKNIANTSAVEELKADTVCGYHLFIYTGRNKKLNYKYYYYILNNSNLRKKLLALSTGTTIIGLSGASLSNSLVPFPSLHEQQTIANYLDTKVDLMDRIINKTNTQIEKLKELRKTLINDVVTGKIKVVTE